MINQPAPAPGTPAAVAKPVMPVTPSQQPAPTVVVNAATPAPVTIEKVEPVKVANDVPIKERPLITEEDFFNKPLLPKKAKQMGDRVPANWNIEETSVKDIIVASNNATMNVFKGTRKAFSAYLRED